MKPQHLYCHIILFFILLLPFNGKTQQPVLPFGINLCGGEFSENVLPGKLYTHYKYPTTFEIDYFAAKGFKLVDILFKWERIQKQLNGPLSDEDLYALTSIVQYCEKKGIQVILSLHNFGRYHINGTDHIVGGTRVTRAHFNDVWQKLASIFKSFSNIYAYDIMHEPHNMGAYDWKETAQQAINTIRKIDGRTAIMIAGNNYAACEKWTTYSDDLQHLQDPANNIVYDAHNYFDYNYSGRYTKSYDQEQIDENIGIKRVIPFLLWLKKHKKRGFIGEYGIPANDPRWAKALDKFLKFLQSHGVNGNYWAAGPLWKDYALSVQPGPTWEERPQLAILKKYLSTPNITFLRTPLKKLEAIYAAYHPENSKAKWLANTTGVENAIVQSTGTSVEYLPKDNENKKGKNNTPAPSSNFTLQPGQQLLPPSQNKQRR